MDANLRLITDTEKKELLVEILTKLDTIFEENNITYYLAYGTLLGAVRHQGFIPWDDDIDLLLPRESFIRLIHLCEEQKEKLKELNLEIVEYGRNKKDYYKRFKIADTRTVMEEFGEERSAVFVDIFPLDCFPNVSQKKLIKYQKKILLIDNLCSLCNYGKGQGHGMKKIIYTIILSGHKIVGCERMKKIYENQLIKLTEYRDNGVLCDSEGGIGHSHFFMSTQWGKMIKIPFEKNLFSVPENYDAVLTMCYGDYMQLPPEEQRHSHEYYKMYWR